MSTILSNKKSTHGSPYVYYTVSVEVTGRTPTSVKLKYTVTAWLQYAASYLLTGHPITVSLYVGGSWHDMSIKSSSTSWRGTAKHKKTSSTITINGVSKSATTLTGLKFKAEQGGGSAGDLSAVSCSNVSIASVAKTYNDVKITLENCNQTEAKVAIKNVPASVGYSRKINWYNGAKKVSSTSISGSSKVTSYTYVYGGLQPNTDYTLRATITYDDVQLASNSVVASTPQETGELTLSPGSTYINAQVSGMFGFPNYNRTIEFYVKRRFSADWILFAAKAEQGTKVQLNITQLLSNTEYDIKVLIKKGTTILRTITDSVSTTTDTSLVPTAQIESISQKLGTRDCTINWITDKSVAGTNYIIEAKADDENTWTELKSLNDVVTPSVVSAHKGNKNILFRIKSANSSVATAVTNYSAEISFYVRDDFVWDTEKKQGSPLVITANEWNRLREYVLALEPDIEIPIVRTGDLITAETYNIMKNAIQVAKETSITEDKTTGDAITASDIDTLRVAINA